MKILTAHQPVYLPWLGLFHKIALADQFCYFDDVQYQPKDWNNRNRIKLANTKMAWLSVPVLRAGYREKSFLEIKINNGIPWRRKHWRTIELNYRKSQFFSMYMNRFKRFYEIEWNYLVELNYSMLLFFLEVLNISTMVVKMSNCSFKGKKSDLVLDMCNTLEADVYIFGNQGVDYADKSRFEASGVIPYFQSYRHPEYSQLYGDFISHLSIIDLLFNCGPSSFDILMSGNIGRKGLEYYAAKIRRKS